MLPLVTEPSVIRPALHLGVDGGQAPWRRILSAVVFGAFQVKVVLAPTVIDCELAEKDEPAAVGQV